MLQQTKVKYIIVKKNVYILYKCFLVKMHCL